MTHSPANPSKEPSAVSGTSEGMEGHPGPTTFGPEDLSFDTEPQSLEALFEEVAGLQQRRPAFVLVPAEFVGGEAVIMSTDYRLPHEDLPALVDALREQQIQGQVVFDLLTANGSLTRRFFATAFDGQGFRSGLKHHETTPALEQATQAYVRAHQSSFDLSLLTPAMRFELLKDG